uniref:Uncharacterized protein n=1 Tax=Bracon brevicornis TaxID=1563983 RepID=A0A6V7KM12_9HYME
MEHARKMVLIPEESINRYRNDNVDSLKATESESSVLPSIQTPGDPISRLDSQMHYILNAEYPLSDYDKWNKLKKVLRKYLYHKSRDEEPMDNRDITKIQAGHPLRSDQFHTAGDVETTVSAEVERSNIGRYGEDLIINGLPKLFKGEGCGLLKFIKITDSNKRLTWNLQGEVILDGKKIAGSKTLLI